MTALKWAATGRLSVSICITLHSLLVFLFPSVIGGHGIIVCSCLPIVSIVRFGFQ